MKKEEFAKIKKTAKYNGQSYLAPQPGLEPGTY